MGDHLYLASLSVMTGLLAACATGPTVNDPVQIYEGPPRGAIYIPFHLDFQPMEKLLLINIEKDPDQHYIGFEPQSFNDEKIGTGILVIAYRNDGFVDVYHEAGLKLDHGVYDLVGQGLHEMIETDFRASLLQIGPTGIDTHIEFTDLYEREIRLRVLETTNRRTRPFSLLAPVADSAVNPPSLPLVILYDFYFVRQAGTEVEVSIDGTPHRPDRLGFPIDGRRVYFMRYSSDPFIVDWNANYEGQLQAHEPDERRRIQTQGATFEIEDNGGYLEIASMHATDGDHELLVEFTPAVPELASLRSGTTVDGEFRITSDPSLGSIAGTYRVERHGAQVVMEIHPSEGWQPVPDRFALRMVYALARPFKNWPKTYLWTATIDIEDGDITTMESRWQRRD